jgi:Aminoglycoside adenylyltransferase, C-terminal domain
VTTSTPSRYAAGPEGVEIASYFSTLVVRLSHVLRRELVGVYAGGSLALGAYSHGRSDLDVAAVSRSRVSLPVKQAIAAALRHEALPCPAPGLELVLYRLELTRSATTDAGFELNLNTGREMAFRADYEPNPAEAFWFPIDRSILARHGIALTGPPAGDVFARIPNQDLVPVIVESLRWHGHGMGGGDDAVLNACRSLRFAVEGVWSSKPEAGQWALDKVEDPELVRAALAAPRDDRALDPQAVARFVATTASLVAQTTTAGGVRR